MPDIGFSKVELHSFSRDQKGGKAHFSAALTPPICRVMEWDIDIPGFLTGGNLQDDLTATSMTLQSEGKLASYETTIKVTKLSGFKFLRLEREGSKGKGHRIELRFDAAFVDLTACAFLEQYLTSAGDTKGSLRVSYNAKAKQEPLIPEPKVSRQGKLDQQAQ